MSQSAVLNKILSDEFRLLSFRPFQPDPSLFNHYLAFGLLVTWLCGVGRYWDNPRADLWQTLGLGSVVYVFFLALVLWGIIHPLKPQNWSYRGVLLFVTLTSPPALLYAIPVERVFSLQTAQTINVWFLAVVAAWRVVLLYLYLKRSAKLSGFTIFVACFLPLTLIVSALTALNLEHVVFRLMAGLEEHEKSANDAAYVILLLITYVSVMLSPVLLAAYGWMVYRCHRRARSKHSAD